MRKVVVSLTKGLREAQSDSAGDTPAVTDKRSALIRGAADELETLLLRNTRWFY
jgi:hypothetical protein